MNVFITGTSSGLGWGLAWYYLNNGHKVWGCSRRTPEDLIKDQNYQHFELDLSDLNNLPSKTQEILPNIPSLDLLILNAGILGKIDLMKNVGIAELQKVNDINLWSNKVLIDEFTIHFKSIQQIVAISSGAAVNGSKGWNAYSISKAALNMMVKLYAAENDQTHFTALAPGLIDTAMQDYLCEEVDQETFSSAKKLAKARGTENMPKAKEAGKLIGNFISRLAHYESGSFVDIRKA